MNKHRILVVDDDKGRHEVFRQNLDPNAYDVTFVQSPAEAEEVLERGARFTLAYLDWDLGPYGYGNQVCDIILKLPEDKRPRSITVHTVMREEGITMCRQLVDGGHDDVAWMPYHKLFF